MELRVCLGGAAAGWHIELIFQFFFEGVVFALMAAVS